MKRALGGLIVIGVLFAAVAVLKRDTSPASGGADSTQVSATERERVMRFWEAYRHATELRIAGQSQPAADAYTRALALDPEHHDALYYLGAMEFTLGNDAAAEAAWRRLVEIDPTSARAHSQLGTLYFCVGGDDPLRPEEATAEFERVAAINREETGPLLSLGEIALVVGNMERAADYLDAVIGSNYTSVAAHFYRGYIEWESGASDRATALLAEAVSLARPARPQNDVPGEGDTKGGARPMVRPPSRCGVMRARATDLDTLDEEVARYIDDVYGSFDDLLQEVRTQLP